MAGAGIVDVVDNVSDRFGTRVWALLIRDDPRNASARKQVEVNRTTIGMFPPHVAVNLSQHRFPTCPIKAGDDISWGPHHIELDGVQFAKEGDEYDPGGPISPP